MKLLNIIITCLLLLFVQPDSAASQITDKPEYGNFAITNVTIHTVSNGLIENGVVLIENDKIAFVGKNVKISDDYRVIDATDKHIYPGFIDSRTYLGLREISAIPVTIDHREVGSFNPEMTAFTAINPHSAAIPVARVEGVTNVISLPASGRISGKATLLDLWGYTPDSMAVQKISALQLNWPSVMGFGRFDSRSEKEIKEQYEKDIKELNEFWSKSETYHRMMTEFNLDPANKKQPDKNQKLDAMRDVLNGEIPVILSVDREKDILNALKWIQEKERVRFVLSGVSEGWRVAEEIADAGVPVIVSTLYTPRRPYDNYQRPYQNPGLLAEAGVKVIFGTGETENVRNVVYNAGFATAYGMDRIEAFKGLTLYAAEVWGVDDRLGSIEEGKQANLFIADGDPFEPGTQIEHVFIKGLKIPMISRHTQLYEEFLDRDAVNR